MSRNFAFSRTRPHRSPVSGDTPLLASVVSGACFAASLALCACSSSSAQGSADGGPGTSSGSVGSTTSSSGATTSSGGSSGSGSGSTSSSGPGDGDASSVADATGGDDGPAADGANGGDSSEGSAPSNARESLVWIPTYLGSFSANLKSVTTHPQSFTVVAPDFYDLNFDYKSGPPNLGSQTYDGLSLSQIVQQVHGAGMKITPLMYAGAGNSGTDQGIQNVLGDSPPGTQNNFITAAVMEAQSMGWDGWDLDWEVGNTSYSQYGVKYVKFLTAFKAALHAKHMVVSITVGDWYIRQCGGDGLVDLTQIGPAVDRVILMDYAGSLGSPLSSCPGGTPPAQQSCNQDFGSLMNLMCDVSPSSAVSIGMIEGSGGSGANPFLNHAPECRLDHRLYRRRRLAGRNAVPRPDQHPERRDLVLKLLGNYMSQ